MGAVYWSSLQLPVQLLMGPDRGLRLDLVGTAGDAVKTELTVSTPSTQSTVQVLVYDCFRELFFRPRLLPDNSKGHSANQG